MCPFLIKAQEEQNTSPKGNKQKPKDKTDQAHETQKDKRRTASNRKDLTATTSQTIIPLSDVDQNNFSGQNFQEKFMRWASKQPPGRERLKPHNEGAAVTAPDGNRAALPVGPHERPCLTPARQDFQAATLPSLGTKVAFSLEKPVCGPLQAESLPVDRASQQ